MDEDKILTIRGTDEGLCLFINGEKWKYWGHGDDVVRLIGEIIEQRFTGTEAGPDMEDDEYERLFC